MNRSTLRFVSFSLIFIGIFLTISALMPILRYELLKSPTLDAQNFLSPVSYNAPSKKSPGQKDLTRASNWFAKDPKKTAEIVYPIKYYKISVPQLKVKDAIVEIGGEDLSKNLIHFKGTALPGKPGNAVIFGHSTLPQLYNPKNYLTVFTYLPSLKKGDEIQVDYDEVKYKFKVEQMFEVKPEDIQILEQRQDNSYLTLVTCVPPGTYLKRLIVRAKIVPYTN
ncbi:MAG: hypothetical protein A3D26_03375 [Candidatus Blackburnbacteria bacterium RIFCSPHIGHO2_02_FULL_44_20]|uniref:Sortase n=1 Tax=Candidatus Blackburnbacteria bacterium RIFCSPHIGHO2_02_FULL_44_20 TaxID=1797516 RepID=A0A1G1V4J5_9BACT|nr:MAG: hypothetical protein A3D26_03375 [Candidatus Blackburnbacteria bacterium RIFCSPHIGHO2_02_FULL_44_20]